MLNPDNIFSEKVYVFKPYVRSILLAHIRRQYQKLHSLYVEELVTLRKSDVRDDLRSQLREIASDTKDYSDTLSNLRQSVALWVEIISAISLGFTILGISISLLHICMQIRS